MDREKVYREKMDREKMDREKVRLRVSGKAIVASVRSGVWIEGA